MEALMVFTFDNNSSQNKHISRDKCVHSFCDYYMQAFCHYRSNTIVLSKLFPLFVLSILETHDIWVVEYQ